MESLLPRDLFVGLEGDVAHLCAGGEAPMLRAGAGALTRFSTLKSQGMAGRDQLYAVYHEVKGQLAQLLGAAGPDEIAFLANASDGLNTLARSVAWRPGDEVVTLAGEFPSSIFPWLAQRRQGIRVRAVEPGTDPEGAIAAAMTARTRLVCVSHVSYLTGLRLDLERLGAITRAAGAILAVDASHSLGALPVAARHCDFVFACCYKFLLATHGVGVCYWNRQRRPELAESAVGWHSVEWPGLEERNAGYRLRAGAARLELGNPSFISLFVLREALALLLRLDPGALEAHLLGLGAELLDGLGALRLPVLTPAAPARRGPNLVFAAPDHGQVTAALAERGVLAWSGDGRVRFSLHGYNDSRDIDRALAALREVMRR